VVALPRFGTPEVGPSAATGGPFSFGQTDWPEFALLRFTNRAGLGRVGGFSIAYVVGATFPLGGGSDRDPARNYPCVDRLSTPQSPTNGLEEQAAGRNVPKEPAARGNGGVQNVLAGTALSVHVAAAIRCQVQSGAGGPTPSRQKS
jgi:hypothetical protein